MVFDENFQGRLDGRAVERALKEVGDYSSVQWQNNLTYDSWGFRPKTPGGCAARMNLGADPRWLRRKCEAGGSAP